MRSVFMMTLLFAALGALSAHAGETATFAYDVHGRLIGVERSGGANDGADTAYAYDGGDNRTSKITTGASTLLLNEPAGGRAETDSEESNEAGDAEEGAVIRPE